MIRDFGANGITYGPNQSSTLTVFDTVVSNNGITSSLTAAINIGPSPLSLGSIAVNAYLDRVQVSGNSSNGIEVDVSGQQFGSLTITVADSVVTGNGGEGVAVSGNAVLFPTATLINTRLTNNSIGLVVATGATAYLAETVISGNSRNGFFIPNALETINTFGNNRITDTNNTGSLTPIAKQ